MIAVENSKTVNPFPLEVRFKLLHLWMKSYSVTIQLVKATEQYFPVVLFAFFVQSCSNF